MSCSRGLIVILADGEVHVLLGVKALTLDDDTIACVVFIETEKREIHVVSSLNLARW